MGNDAKDIDDSRKKFLEEFVKMKYLMEARGAGKKLEDKVGFIKAMKRILGL